MSEKLHYVGGATPCNDRPYPNLNHHAIFGLDIFNAYTASMIFANGQPYILTDTWYKFETWMVMDSAVDAADGVLQIWCDDVLIFDRSDVDWRSTDPGRASLGTAWQSMWFGGNYTGTACGGPSTTLYRYMDDLYVSTTLDR